MGQPTIGAGIKLTGEKEFKNALSEINSGLRVNQSELNLTSAEYANNSQSVEALTAKSKALQNTIYSQIDKVKLLEKAMKSSAEKHGESDKKTSQWQISLNKAKADLAKMNNELGENQKALKKAEKGTTSLADVVKGLSNTIGVDIPPAMQGFVGKLDGVNASAATLVGVLAGIVTGLSKMTIETAKVADDLLTLSATSGMTTDQLQELRYASEFVDVSVETMDSSMTKLIKSMDSARSGSREQADAFRKLHISYKDTNGQLKDSNTVFFEMIDALGNVKNETDRDALAMTLLGESARDLNPLIEVGSGKLKELGQEAHNVGYVMSEETLGKFGQLDNAMQRMSKQSDAFKNSLATAMLPILTSLFESLSKIPVPVLQTVITLATVITTILLTVKAIKGMTDGVGGIIKMFDDFDVKSLKTTAIIMGVVAGVIILTVAIAALCGKADDIERSMESAGNAMGNLNNQVSNTQNSYQRIPSYALGTPYHSGGFARINDRKNDPYSGEVIDLPTGSRVYPAGTVPTGGGDTFHITIDAKNVREFNDIVNMAKNARQQRRARG